MTYTRPIFWAAAMIVLALLARFGLADRDAVITLMLVLPILAIVSLRGEQRCVAARS